MSYKKYCNDSKQDERLVKNAVVTLNELNGVLLALVLNKVASIFISEITHDLDAVESAVIHSIKRTFY
jgi:hypothetical protein